MSNRQTTIATSLGVGRFSRHLGLRARVTAFFGLGACLLSVFLAASTYLVVRHTLIDQRETLAERQTFINARLLRPGLRVAIDSKTGEPQPSKVNVPGLLGGLENPTGSSAVLYYQGKWFTSDLNAGQETLPETLRNKVVGGTPAHMRFKNDGHTYLSVGLPIPAVGASYFEVSELEELDRTLSILEITLFIASLITTVGGAVLGRWVSGVVLAPVTQAAYAAETIAAGAMDTRLTPDGDADLDRLVLSFNRMVDALQGRIERDARFASDVSHELRSPLMTLSSGLSVLLGRRHELPPRSQTALDLLADEVQRFQRMVQDLLEISRTDAGPQDVSLDEVLVGEFVERVVESYEREIPIVAEPGVEDAILLVDKRRMERVIGNLIENADRYAGGPIQIGIASVGDNVQISVDDAGPGVPVEERDRVFERFARGATARARASGEGTGLGLSLVHEHVKLHKGAVWVEDRPGGGARFIVELPKVEL